MRRLLCTHWPSMPATRNRNAVCWSEYVGWTLRSYDQPFLRSVAARLLRPRNQWPAEELVSRAVQALDNRAVLDRRLKELSDHGRRLLAMLGRSRQPRWCLSNLVELLTVLGSADGVQSVRELVESGLLY